VWGRTAALRSLLDPTVQIKSGFHSSRFRHLRCQNSQVLRTRDSPIPDGSFHTLALLSLAPGQCDLHSVTTTLCLSIGVSAFSVSRCTCTRNPRFSDPRCAPFPSLSPFWLHNGPCDLLSRDHHHTSRRGFRVSHFLMSRVSHLSNPRLPMRPFPRASPAGYSPWPI
jgi:hypothetical protein